MRETIPSSPRYAFVTLWKLRHSRSGRNTIRTRSPNPSASTSSRRTKRRAAFSPGASSSRNENGTSRPIPEGMRNRHSAKRPAGSARKDSVASAEISWEYPSYCSHARQRLHSTMRSDGHSGFGFAEKSESYWERISPHRTGTNASAPEPLERQVRKVGSRRISSPEKESLTQAFSRGGRTSNAERVRLTPSGANTASSNVSLRARVPSPSYDGTSGKARSPSRINARYGCGDSMRRPIPSGMHTSRLASSGQRHAMLGVSIDV